MQHKRISNYIFNIKDVIGQGFSSVVYKGRHIDQHQPLAIKVIELKNITNEVQKQLLNNQIHALRITNHPSVIKLHDIYQTNNNIYIIMEMGQANLTHRLQHGGMNQHEALTLLSKLVDGFIHLQQNAIIHRDVKPNNILLIANHPKIVDFGFCEVINCHANKTKKYYNVGSPKYMSPEAYKKTIYSHKSDMWALGKLPFDGLQYDQMIQSISSGECFHKMNLTGLTKIILSRMLAVDLERRFDFNQLKTLLKNHLTNPPMDIQPKRRNSILVKRVDRVISKDLYDRKIQLPTQPPENTSNQNYYTQHLLAPITPAQPFNNITNKYIQNQVDQKVHHLFKNPSYHTHKPSLIRPSSSTHNITYKPNKNQNNVKIHQIIKVISILHSDPCIRVNLEKIKLLQLCYYLGLNHLRKSMQEYQLQKQSQLSNLQIILSGYKYLQYQQLNGNDKYYSYLINNINHLPLQQIYFYINFWVVNAIKIYYSDFNQKYTIQDVNKNQQAYSSFMLVVRLYQLHSMLIGEKQQKLEEIEGKINSNWMEEIKRITNNINNQK